VARPDFRAAAARRLNESRELSPNIVSLLDPESRHRPTAAVRQIAIDQIDPNPEQPRLEFDEDALDELAGSIREHGVLQPILVRPRQGNRFQLIAGERRWRASKRADRATIPALVEDIDDETALEISIIENLQREDLSPLDEATMYDRMIRDHGYSIRKLAEKLGKDKGYLENRLRLADAPEEVRQLVSVRKDTLSHAYELLKVADPKKRKKLADAVARGELSLVKLREKVEGGTARRRRAGVDDETDALEADAPAPEPAEPEGWAAHTAPELVEDSLVSAKRDFADALEDLVAVLRSPDVVRTIPDIDRANLAKYLTIAKLRLENAIAIVRSGPNEG
jgi:ParB family transcriptional regulator, chromosome partitioning protein